MPDAVFIETTIPSYYVARPSRDLFQLVRQQLTRRCWDEHLSRFDLRTSQMVIDKAAEGDPDMATQRLKLLADLPQLEVTGQAADLATKLVNNGILPKIAVSDGLHIATAAVHRVPFLLTWNCKHIANPHIRERIRICFSRHGVELPVICTPEEFIGDDEGPFDL